MNHKSIGVFKNSVYSNWRQKILAYIQVQDLIKPSTTVNTYKVNLFL